MRLSRPFRFDPEKGLEIILYVSNRIANKDVYWVLKAPYFADKYHLEDCGRPVSADIYYAMKDGPVPGGMYDLFKDVKYDRRSPFAEKAKAAFKVEGDAILPRREANLEFFSKSDLESLDRAISDVGKLSFAELKDRSHDTAVDEADRNGEIPFDAIVKTLPRGELLLTSL